MAFSSLAQKPITKKNVLVEVDLTTIQQFWANYTEHTFFLDFDQVYDDIGSAFLSGVDTLATARVGSVLEDGIAMVEVNTSGSAVTTEKSFHWDQAGRQLFIHCSNGDEPALHDLRIGEPSGFSKQPVVFNGVPYHSRLLSVPKISKARDPNYFSVIAFRGGAVIIDNHDGEFDTWAEDNNDVYGNPVRILLGFDDDPYSEYRKMFSGYIERVDIGPDSMVLDIQDGRKQLSRVIPENTYVTDDRGLAFTPATYPNLSLLNQGRPIPYAYGTIKKAEAVCLNEEVQGGATYTFKLADTSYHSIKSIDTVYVATAGGLESTVVPASTDLREAEFVLQASAYAPGNLVTCDFKGFDNSADKDSSGTLIENALDVIADLLEEFYKVTFNSSFYDTSEWPTASAPNIGYLIDSPVEVTEAIGRIASSVPGNFIIKDDGTYMFRIYDGTASAVQSIKATELFEPPRVRYDSDRLVNSVRVGYGQAHHASRQAGHVGVQVRSAGYRWLTIRNFEAASFAKYKTYRERNYETLLIDGTAASVFGSAQLTYFADIHGEFDADVAMQLAEREVMDLINVDVDRANSTMLGTKKIEIVGLTKDLDRARIVARCRIT
tara:strand:- start:1358 stop:3175 length:1818 start_codon:yes stop_codon:yes gene_type:complete